MIKKNLFQNLKKFIIASSIAICLFFAGQTAFEMAEVSAYADTYGDFEYYTDYAYDGVYISDYKGTAGTVTIPSTINGKTVTSIGGSAFYSDRNVTKVVLPNTIKKLVTLHLPDVRN